MERFDYSTLKVDEVNDHVLLVTLNRPEVLNAINTQMGRDLLAFWHQMASPGHQIRCIVLTGAGDRAFSAGGDLKERNGMSEADWRSQHEIFEQAFIALVNCPVPVIAAVNGHAVGGGLETALGCDFIYASRGARLGLTEVSLGIMPGSGGTQTLGRAVGERRAKEMILTAIPCLAEEAATWGLVNRLCDPDTTVSTALETADRIASNGPLATRHAKKSIHYGLQMDIFTGYRFEIDLYNVLASSEDRIEGISAFNEKRQPNFVGR